MRQRLMWTILALCLITTAHAFAGLVPEGCEVWPWEFGATADVFRDSKVTYSGEHALGVGKTTGSIGVAIPKIRINPGQSLRTRAWVRTELTGDQEAQVSIYFYDVDDNFIGGETSDALSGQADWTCLEIQTPRASLEDVTKVAIVLEVMGAGRGTAWFDALELIYMDPYGRVEIPNSGFEKWGFDKKDQRLKLSPKLVDYSFSVWHELKYTPEHKWENTDRVRLYLTANIDDKYRAWIQTWGSDIYTNYYDGRNFTPNFDIRAFEVKAYPKVKNQNLELTFGRLTLPYSSLVLYVVDDLRGGYAYKHGISVGNITFGEKSSLDAYIFPDGSSQFNWGGRYQYKAEDWKLNSVLFNKNSVDSKLLENDLAIGLNYNLPGEKTLELDWAQQKKFSDEAEVTNAAIVSLNGKLYDLGYSLRRYNFSLAFDPPYRDRYPLYSWDLKQITEWNLVDRYQGKDGYGLTVKGTEGSLSGLAEVDLWRGPEEQKTRIYSKLNTNAFGFRVGGEILSKGQTYTNRYGAKVHLPEYTRWGISLNKEFYTPLPLACGYSFESENYQGSENKVSDLYAQYQIKEGVFKGLALKAGWEHSNLENLNSRVYLEGKWTLPNRLQIYWRHYSKDAPDSWPYFDSVRERYYDYDNQFWVSYNASFY